MWLQFQFPVTVQEFGSADFVDFSADGDYFAVTASARVSCQLSHLLNSMALSIVRHVFVSCDIISCHYWLFHKRF